jgi:hypothetical protein
VRLVSRCGYVDGLRQDRAEREDQHLLCDAGREVFGQAAIHAGRRRVAAGPFDDLLRGGMGNPNGHLSDPLPVIVVGGSVGRGHRHLKAVRAHAGGQSVADGGEQVRQLDGELRGKHGDDRPVLRNA